MGFLAAEVRLLGCRARFRSVGGIDNDPASCKDFVHLTDSPALCGDIAQMVPEHLREFAGERAPDVVFMSPPCKSFSALLSKAASASPKYREMSRLVVVFVKLMLDTWSKSPPGLVLLENVPRIATRGASLLREVRKLLRAAGYVFHAQSHDCGELGGLAQHRKRYLLVARHPKRVPPLLYQPPKRRVRACGEVLEQLPVPGGDEGGPMHRLPKLSWLNWLRLALIPAGGDWRDLEGVLEDGQARREVFRRHHVGRWDEPIATVAGSGSNGPTAVADPRVALDHTPRRGTMRVMPWTAPSSAVTGQSGRVGHVSAGAVADPRVRTAYDHGYGVLRWNESSPTVAGGSHPGQGAYSVADPRRRGLMTWQDALALEVEDARKPPPAPPIIVAADGTWHRPLTTLELAALQGFPAEWKGRPLALAGRSQSAWRERIGNAVPPPTARAIAEQMLLALAQAGLETWAMSVDGQVWVRPEARTVAS
jgi:site-specific DNA-cytosine methylase